MAERDIELSVGLDTSDVDAGAKRIESALNKAFNSSSKKTQQWGNQLQKTVQNIQSVKNKLDELGKQQIPTKQFEAVQKSIEATKQSLNSLETELKDMMTSGTAFSNTPTKAYSDLQKQQKEALANLNSASNSSDIEKYKAQLTEIQTKINELKASGEAYELTDEFRQKKTEAEALRLKLAELNAEQEKIRTGGTQFEDPTKTQAYIDTKSQLTGLNAQAFGLVRNIEGAEKATGGLKGMWLKLGSFIGGKIKSLKDKILSFGKTHKQATTNMIGQLLKYAFRLTTVIALFRKLVPIVKQGILQMTKSFPEINEQVSALVNSWGAFKSSIVSAFQPIISFVIPILVTLIDYLTSAMNALANFFAILTGQKTYKKAVKGNKDVASSIDNTGNSADKADEKLADYDKLLVIDQDKGGSGGGADSGYNWTEEAVQSNDFIDELKKYWENGDWEGLGATISKKLTDMMESIPWESIYKKAANFGKGLAEFLNGLITPELFSAVGATIAGALNTALAFLKEFGKTFDWTNFGDSIAAGINRFFKEFQFSDLVETLNIWVNGLLTTLITAVQKTDWTSIAQNIADGIAKIDASGIGWKLGTLVNSLIDAFNDLISNIEMWKNLGTKMAEGINGFLKSFDIGKALTALGNLVAGVATALAEFLSKTDWSLVGEKLVDALKSIFTDIPWDKVVGAIGTLALASIKSQFTFGAGALAEITESLSEFFKSIGLDSVAGFFEGLTEKINGAKQFIEDLFDKIITWVKDFFGINSPSKKFAEIGEYCIDGIKKGLGDAVSAIGTWIKENVVDKILSAFDKVKEITATIKGKIDKTFDKAKEAWDALKTKTETLWTEAKEKVKGAIDKLKSKWDDWKATTKELWTEAKEKAGNLISTIKEAWTNGWTTTKELFAEAKEKTTGAIQNLKDTWSQWSPVVKNLYADAKEKVRGAIAGLKKVWHDWLPTTKQLYTDAKEKVSGAIDKLKNAWNTWTGKDGKDSTTKELKAEATDDGTIKTVKDSWDSITTTKTLSASFKKDTVKNLKEKVKKIKEQINKIKKTKTITFKTKGLSAIEDAYDKLSKGISVTVDLAKGNFTTVAGWLTSAFGATSATKQSDGSVLVKSPIRKLGGILDSATGMWKNIPQYASGTANALNHGSMFIAGEAGPEVVGHIGGRTEVLNKSQIASAIKSAVIDGMMQVLNAIPTFNLNLNLPSLDKLPPIPVVVTGQLLPLTEAFMFKFEEQHKDLEDIKAKIDEIITRLSTVESSNHEPIVLQLDGKTIVQLVWDATQKRYKQTGKPMFA